MNKEDKIYWKSLIGTFLFMNLFALGVRLIWFMKEWSYLYLIGIFNIIVCFIIIFRLVGSHIKYIGITQ